MEAPSVGDFDDFLREFLERLGGPGGNQERAPDGKAQDQRQDDEGSPEQLEGRQRHLGQRRGRHDAEQLPVRQRFLALDHDTLSRKQALSPQRNRLRRCLRVAQLPQGAVQ